ncbi:MAG: hypothetical protein ACI9F2_000734 [Lysobacterales bacterium]|jgi:hypothetical protein
MKNKLSSLLFLYILFSTSSGWAQLVIDESRLDAVVAPARSIVNNLVLRNLSSKTKDVKIYWQDFDYVDPFKGDKKFKPPGTSEFSMADFVTVTPTTVRVEPSAKADISYAIKMPTDAEGSYYGVLFFEEVDPDRITETGVKIVMRIGALFFVSTTDNRSTADISNFKVDQNTITADFENQGRTILFPQGTYYVMDQEGLVVDRGEIKKMFLPAQKVGKLKWDLDSTLKAGDYSIILTFELGHGYSVVKEIDIEKKYDEQLVIKDVRN